MPMPAVPPPPPPSPSPPIPDGALLILTTGPNSCSITNDGACWTDGPGDYSNNAFCVARAVEDVYVTARQYDVEALWDYVIVDGLRYNQNTGPRGPQQQFIKKGAVLAFNSDFSGTRSGFTICASISGPPMPPPSPPALPPPPAPPKAPLGQRWQIVSGGLYCHLINLGTCITDGDDDYGSNERCEFRSLVDQYVTALHYDVEACCDFLSAGTTAFKGSPNGPKNFFLAAGSTMVWRADAGLNRGGFTVCGTSAEFNAYPPPSPSPPPPSPKPPPWPPGQAPPTIFYSIDYGSCGTNHVHNLEECERAATILAFSDNSAEDDGQTAVNYDPPGCYYEANALKYNEGLTNTGPCTKLDVCICRGFGPPSTPPSLPKPPPPPPSPSPPPPRISPAPPATGNAHFHMIHGSPACQIVPAEAGTPYAWCVTDGFGDYGNNERCTWMATVDIYVTATEYVVENFFDYLAIGHEEYHITGHGPEHVLVRAGQTMSWHSDAPWLDSGVADGFNLCSSLTAPPPSPPTSPPFPPGAAPPATFHIQTTGRCPSPVTSKALCTQGGRLLANQVSLSGYIVVEDDNQPNGVTYDPPFCYVENGNLKFNAGANIGPCTSGDVCICIGALPPPPPPPFPLPPPPSPAPPPPSPTPASPLLSPPAATVALPALKLTATVAGTVDTFNKSAYALNLARLVAVPASDISVSVSAARLRQLLPARRLQGGSSGSLLVVAEIIANPSGDLTADQVASQLEQTLAAQTPESLTTALAVEVKSFTKERVVVNVYAPPPAPGGGQALLTPDALAAQTAGGSPPSSGGSPTAGIVVGAIVGTAVFLGLVAFAYAKLCKRFKSGPRLTTVVTTIQNPIMGSTGLEVVDLTAISSTSMSAEGGFADISPSTSGKVEMSETRQAAPDYMDTEHV